MKIIKKKRERSALVFECCHLIQSICPSKSLQNFPSLAIYRLRRRLFQPHSTAVGVFRCSRFSRKPAPAMSPKKMSAPPRNVAENVLGTSCVYARKESRGRSTSFLRRPRGRKRRRRPSPEKVYAEETLAFSIGWWCSSALHIREVCSCSKTIARISCQWLGEVGRRLGQQKKSVKMVAI